MQTTIKPFLSRLYGRKQTRALGIEQQHVMDALFPHLAIPAEEAAHPASIDPQALFPKSQPVWLEIGFGNGEHLSGLMRRHPEYNFIGAEPFLNGMGAFIKDIKDDPHENIRVWNDDALPLVRALKPESVDGLYVLNPDPWPKKRHIKRRIISQANLTDFARILKPGAAFIMATDMNFLAEWMVTQAMIHPAFEWTAESPADWQTMPEDWIETRYQKKGAGKGRTQTYLLFRKKA